MLLFSSILLLETKFHFNQDKIGCTVLTDQLTRCLKNHKSFLLILHIDHESSFRDLGIKDHHLKYCITVMGIREPRLVFPQQVDAVVKSDKTHWSEIVTWTLIPAIKKARNSNLLCAQRGKKWKYLLKTWAALTDPWMVLYKSSTWQDFYFIRFSLVLIRESICREQDGK